MKYFKRTTLQAFMVIDFAFLGTTISINLALLLMFAGSLYNKIFLKRDIPVSINPPWIPFVTFPLMLFLIVILIKLIRAYKPIDKPSDPIVITKETHRNNIQ